MNFVSLNESRRRRFSYVGDRNHTVTLLLFGEISCYHY